MSPVFMSRAISATDLLVQASDAIEQRAKLRDQPSGERSMLRTVQAFNALHGTHLSEVDGWHFMALLKLARATAGATHLDDYIDMAAYATLAGESAAASLVNQLRPGEREKA